MQICLVTIALCIGVISAHHGQDFGYKYVTKHDGHHGGFGGWDDNGAHGGLNAGYGHYQDYYVNNSLIITYITIRNDWMMFILNSINRTTNSAMA